MKVYIVVDACSGEDYSADDPAILLVTDNQKKAKQFFDNEIAKWEDGLEDFDADVSDHASGGLVYECTDYEGDSHRVMKLIEKEVK